MDFITSSSATRTILFASIAGLLLGCGGGDQAASTAGTATTTGGSSVGGSSTSGSSAGGGGAGGKTAGATTANSSVGAGGAAGQGIPTTAAALLPWLQQGNYSSWKAESAKHASMGPHFGGVRTFMNESLNESLAANATSHKKGAAAVKELFGMGETVLGWAVWVKLEDDSAMGQNIYWYEFYQDQTFADGTGVGGCTNCHAAGSDYFRSNFPLQ